MVFKLYDRFERTDNEVNEYFKNIYKTHIHTLSDPAIYNREPKSQIIVENKDMCSNNCRDCKKQCVRQTNTL